MRVFISEFDTLRQNIAGAGSQGTVYDIGKEYVIKAYDLMMRPYYEEIIKKQVKDLKKLDHPHINTPIDYRIVGDGRSGNLEKTMQVLYKKMYPILISDFSGIIHVLEYGMRGGFNENEIKIINDEITSKGWQPYRRNILGLIDAYNMLYRLYKTTLDIHEGNIMQDGEGTWKIIDF